MGEKAQKKRKRHDDASNTHSRKKLALDSAAAGNIEVSFVEQGAPPVLACAPGLSTSAKSFQAFSKPKSSDGRNDAPKPQSHHLLLHSSEHPRLDYTALPPIQDERLAHYIAVYDPSSNKLQLHPTHQLNLRGVVRATDESDEDPENEKAGGTRSKAAQQRLELGREFGSIRSKRALEGAQANAIVRKDDKSNAGISVEKAILDAVALAADETKARKAEEAEAALATKPIPKPNLTTREIDEVYTFDTLVPPATARLIKVKEWQEKTRNDEPMDFAHRFTAHRVQAIGKSDNVSRLVALRYMNYLLEYHDVLRLGGRPGKKVPKRDILLNRLSEWPPALVDAVTKRFSPPSYELTKWHQDNLYTHMCALALFIDRWTTEISDLRLDLKKENKDLTQYFRELGAAVRKLNKTEMERLRMKSKEAQSTRMAELKLPLDFPKVSMGRKTA